MARAQGNFVWKVTPRMSYWNWPAGAVGMVEDLRTMEEQGTAGVADGDIGGLGVFEFPD